MDGSAVSGVYLHNDSVLRKALGYAYWVSPWADSLFWKCCFEVRLRASGRVPLHGLQTDQLVYTSESVTLKALWITVRPLQFIPNGEGAYTCWKREEETVAAP